MEMLQQFTAAAATATARCPPPPTAAQPLTTTAQMEAAIATLHDKKQRLREAYDSLVLSSPIPLPFRWSDLDAHLSSLQSSIDARFSQIQALEASGRPAPPAAAARHGVEYSSEDVEMEDVQQHGVKEEMAAQAATAAKMGPPPMAPVKEEAVEVSLTPPCGAVGLAAACASMDAPRLADPAGKSAGVGQDGFARYAGVGQGGFARHGVPPIPSHPVLQQQHMANARPKGSHPVLRQQHNASSMNAGDSVFRPQQHMGKPRDAGDLLTQQQAAAPNAGDRQRQQRAEVANACLTCPLPPPVIVGPSLPPPVIVGMFMPNLTNPLPPPPPLPPPSQARVGVANLTNPLQPSLQQQQFTAGDFQLQKRLQQPVAKPTDAGDLLPQKQQFTANASNAGRPLQERQNGVAKPTDDAGDLLPQQQQLTANTSIAGKRPFQERRQQQFTVNTPTAGEHPLQEQRQRVGVGAGDLLRQQQQLTVNAPNAGERLLPQERRQQQQCLAKPTNPACNLPPQRQQHAANATDPVLRRQHQNVARPPNAGNLPQPKQEEEQPFMADADGTNARNPQQPPCGMANPPNSGDLQTEKHYQQLMDNKHSAPVSTPFVASNQIESATTAMNKNRNSGATGLQPVAAAGAANRRGGRGHGNKNNNIANNTNISNMSKVIGKGTKCNGNNPQFNKNNGPGDQKSKNAGQLCYRCGCRGHWSRICRTPEHLVILYQQDRKAKQAAAAANTIYVGTMTD